MIVPRPSVTKRSQRGARAATLRLALLLGALTAIAACTQPTTASPKLIATGPATVSSGTSFEVHAAIDRADQLTGSVEVTLAPATGFSAAAVSTSADSATLVVDVDAAVTPGDYTLTFNASDGTRNVTDELSVTVSGPAPASIEIELRSLLLPTPGDIGFPVPEEVHVVSMVPGADVPAEFSLARFVPGELVVRFAPGAALARTDSLTADGVRFTPVAVGTGGGSVQVLKTTAALSLEQTVALAATVQARSDVISASPNWLFNVHQATVRYELQWHYPAIGLHNAWSVTTGEDNPVVVGVLDTGYQEHPDLDGLFVPGYDFANDDDDARDGTGGFSHGTHVSGTIAVNLGNGPGATGINRGASILPVKVLGDSGSGSFLGIIYGMVWASGVEVDGYDMSLFPENENPARVLNLSLGGRTGGCPDEMAFVTQTLADAGVVIVVSAGNDGQDIRFYAPASCPGVITVGASGPYDYRASYSNFGAIDIVAPGGDSTYDYVSASLPFLASASGPLRPAGVFSHYGVSGYAWADGTSMAAPHVSGVASLLLSNDPSLSATDVKDILLATATPMTLTQCGLPSLAQCGAGLLNAAAALGADESPWPGAPVGFVDVYACTEDDCSDLDEGSEPIVSLEQDMSRGFTYLSVPDLAAGTYFVDGYVLSEDVHPLIEFQWDARVIQLEAGDVNDLILEAWPD